MWVIKNKIEATSEQPDSINRAVSKAAILFSVAAVLLTHRPGARADVYGQDQTGLMPGRNIAILYRMVLSGVVIRRGY